jgi:hypothetical protein
MELRLYKEPYQEPYSTNRLRLLFEGAVDATGEVQVGPDSDGRDASRRDTSRRDTSRRDVYLYVWIEDRLALSGFQAVLDEEFVLDFHAPAKIEFSRISGRPVKRSLSRPLTGRERRGFLACLKDLSNQVFPDLIRKVEAIAHGETVDACTLTKEEIVTLNKLAEASSGVPKRR